MRIQLLFPSQGIVLMSLLMAPCLWAQKDMKPEATEVWEPEPGSITVFHNGVLIQNGFELLGTTEYIGKPKKGRDSMPGYDTPTSLKRTLMLQDHGDLVSFRNIWLRKL
jgi:hypothetical protein